MFQAKNDVFTKVFWIKLRIEHLKNSRVSISSTVTLAIVNTSLIIYLTMRNDAN